MGKNETRTHTFHRCSWLFWPFLTMFDLSWPFLTSPDISWLFLTWNYLGCPALVAVWPVWMAAQPTLKSPQIGPNEVRALAEQLTVDHYFAYFGLSGVRALPLADCTNEGGHYFRYFSSWYILRRQAYISCAESSYHRYSKPQKGLS